jgi:Spy/CpxP family protein refolding chaperone|uniref:Periplasmic heavy metal sensor n=1 Tax=candidate division WOR-3 bacterium TaxID=2052148 RepID=A0A7V6CN24_UNCW3
MKTLKTFLIFSLFSLAFILFAQPCPCPESNPHPRETIENLRLWRLTEELNLTEEQSAKIFPKWKKLRELREKRREEREKELEKLSELLLKKAKDDEIKKQVNMIKENDKKNREECEKLEEEIFSLLTPIQQAKYLLFHMNFEAKIKGMIKKLKRWKR